MKKQHLVVENITFFMRSPRNRTLHFIFSFKRKRLCYETFCKHGFSVENTYEMLGKSDIKLIQEIYGKPKPALAIAVFNSKNAKVMVKETIKNSKPENIKIVFTLKPRHFPDNTNSIPEESFQRFLTRIAGRPMGEFLEQF